MRLYFNEETFNLTNVALKLALIENFFVPKVKDSLDFKFLHFNEKKIIMALVLREFTKSICLIAVSLCYHRMFFAGFD
jgi:hypothetical protein